jgi:hypothetical protein
MQAAGDLEGKLDETFGAEGAKDLREYKKLVDELLQKLNEGTALTEDDINKLKEAKAQLNTDADNMQKESDK